MHCFTSFVVIKGNYTQSDTHYQIIEIVILMISRIPNLILLNVSGRKCHFMGNTCGSSALEDLYDKKRQGKKKNTF